MQNDEFIINNLKHGQPKSLEIIYQKHRKDFLRWAVYKYNIETEQAEDVFSDAVIDVYHNIVNGRYTKNVNTTLKSYLFEIGKYKILNLLNKNKMSESHLKRIALNTEYSYQLEQGGFFDMAKKVNELLLMIDEKCRKVLTLFYFDNLSMEQIAEALKFKNQDVAKNKKLKCLKRIQSLAFGRVSKEDMYD
ncbi:MAG: sigma-70 family RNA polymerase sigma factor [Bacteroidales bacterium]|jgi:RNA polymerase sigma factor (sigma-70 family)|nr:sigma-70 family RNA polymerase sigma factor [Bacteroidales bacterium]MDD4213990.1 sigma-70 family RNA polymerase sigma factor [Bacteroidales bacterium]